jgi:cbb3-type cytochrome oxidase subunit 3
MSAAEISLLAVTVAFVSLVVWVYWPTRRQRLEEHASMPLEDEPHSHGKPQSSERRS